MRVVTTHSFLCGDHSLARLLGGLVGLLGVELPSYATADVNRFLPDMTLRSSNYVHQQVWNIASFSKRSDGALECRDSSQLSAGDLSPSCARTRPNFDEPLPRGSAWRTSPPSAQSGAKSPHSTYATSPFAERGEKVAAGRMRGAATCAVAANPSPRPSPLAPQREREPKRAQPSAAPFRIRHSPFPIFP